MNFKQLKYFETICKYDNITKAADELFMSQPALTIALKKLEEEYNTKLFDRKGNKITVTQNGKMFQEQVEQLLEQIQRFENNVQNIGNIHKTIRLGMPPGISFLFLNKIYGEFFAKYPYIQIELYESGITETRELVEKDLLDVAIVIKDCEYDDSITFKKILSTEYFLCTSSYSRFAYKSSISFRELENEPLLLFKPGKFLYAKLMDAFNAYHITPNFTVTTNQLSTAYELISNKIVSGFTLKREGFYHNLKFIKLEEPIEIEIGVIWKADNCSDEVSFLIDFITSQ